MFRRQLLQTSRAATRSLRQTPQVQQLVPSSQYSSLQSSSSRVIRSSQPSIQQYFSRRNQSTEASQEGPKPGAAPGTDATTNANADLSSAGASEDASKQEIEKKNKEIIDLKDKYLRSVADYRNLQDRTKRDNTNARQFAIQKFAADLLDSIDNLDRALSAVPASALGQQSTDSSSSSTVSNTSSADPNVAAPQESSSSSAPNADLLNLHSGLRMTEKILLQTLEKHGLTKYDPIEREGQKFDPNLDEATFFAPQQGKENGTVFYTQQKGFTLNGRVIRAAKVGVVKNS